MDATLHGCHPAIRQSLAPNNAGGSAELKGITPPPKIDEAPTFDHYTNQAQLFRSERTLLFLQTKWL